MKSLLAFAFSYRGVLVALCPLGCALPAWITIDTGVQTALGALLLLVGTWLRLAGVREVGGRARVHSAGARDLLTRGIFARTRNPLYLGNGLAAAGAIALIAGPLAALVAGVYLGLLYALVVRHEERVLEALWGDAYRAYLRRVPRWIPRLASASARDGAPAPFAWSEVLRLEQWGVLAALGAIALRLAFPTAIDALMQRAEIRSACAALALLVFAVLFARRAARSKRKHGLLFRSE